MRWAGTTSEVLSLKTLIIASVLTLTGCTAPGVQRAAEAYDDSLAAAEVWMCRGASVGSIVRAYGRSDESWEAWRQLCGYQGVDVHRPVPE